MGWGGRGMGIRGLDGGRGGGDHFTLVLGMLDFPFSYLCKNLLVYSSTYSSTFCILLPIVFYFPFKPPLCIFHVRTILRFSGMGISWCFLGETYKFFFGFSASCQCVFLFCSGGLIGSIHSLFHY